VLKQFSPAQKTRLFALWSGQDQFAELLRAVETHSDWLEFAWPGIARYRAGRHEFAEAWQLVKQHAPAPSLPQAGNNESMPQLERKLYASANDYAVGYTLFRAQMAAGKIDDALATARHFSAQSDAPAYFYFLQAEAWAGKENWEHAWQSWEEYEAAVLHK
jgi:hypothetical protein